MYEILLVVVFEVGGDSFWLSTFRSSFLNYTVKEGEKIAQMVIEKCELPVVEEAAYLGDTVRQSAGFGSSSATTATCTENDA